MRWWWIAWRASPLVWGARLAVAMTPAGFVGVLLIVSPTGEPSWWWAGLLGPACLRRPDSAVVLAGWAALWVLWLVAAPEGAWAAAVVAAVLTLLGHCAAALLSGAQADLHGPTQLRRRWAARALAVAGAAAAVGGLGWALTGGSATTGHPDPPRAGSVLLTCAVLVVAGGWAALVARLGARPRED